MSDPFAHLLTSLKNKDSGTESKKTTPQTKNFTATSATVVASVATTPKGNNNGLHSLSASPIVPVSNVSFSAAPLVPSNSNSNANTAGNTPSPSPANVEDDFDDLFGSNTIETSDGLQEVDQLYYGNNDGSNGGDNVLVDEVKDMEIARLMSLGLSIEKATDFYNSDITYERYLEISKLNQKKHKDRIVSHRPTDLSYKNASLFNNTNSNNNNNLFSMATDFFNKGKELVDQWTSFPPEANDRLSNYANVEDKPDHYELPLKNDSHEGSLPEKKKYEKDLLGGNDLDDDLLTDFETKVDIAKKNTKGTTPSPSPSPGILVEDTLRKETPQTEDNLLDFSTDNINSTNDSAIFSEDGNANPVVPISDIELSGYNEFKAKGTSLFKNGDYVNSLQEYEKSLNSLPLKHPLRVIALSNIIASQLKIGEYSKSIKNSDTALALFPSAKPRWNDKISKSDPQRSFNDIWPKIMIKRAESFEHLESFKNALETYQELIEKNFFDDKIMQGKRRCQSFVNPIPVRKPSPVKKTTPTPAPMKKPTSSPSPDPVDNASRVKEQELENAKLALYDNVSDRIGCWKCGKDDDIRHLLANLSSLLTWCNWKDVSVQDLVMPKKVKITYMKAVAKTHPDKIPKSLSLENKMIAENVFTTLSIAWDKFKQQNEIN
ncbi:auxilin-like protein SWA2 [Saccharomyces eubayanus]|uniref:auxilin-like protein SWA2 n=1 Tax=Saccharomyces eubayanus TaxID=1080349 RepID=UPI0006C24C75|nr:SWA2-like protein [Saccharomyces eubayanus]KOH01146.1 SWA2-like protein [Saccharomyces eubayanus]